MTVSNTAKECVRKDVWSVKHFDRSINAWCHDYMTYDREKARRRCDAIRKGIWYGFDDTLCKLVHPKQWVVEGFVAAGNSIER
jgi:hypothetical protein